MTPAQLATLKTAILADGALSALPRNGDNDVAIAQAFNATATPQNVVWRTSVTAVEIMSNGFVWTAVDALTVGKARIWDWMTRFGSINPSKANIRTGLSDCFGGGSAMATAIMPHLKRDATRGEVLYLVGAVGTTSTPQTLVFEGTVSPADVDAALNLP
jgi:hypothetical protein